MTSTSQDPTRLEGIRAAVGAAVLLLPGVTGRIEALGAAPLPLPLLRVLGVRQLLQAAATAAGGRPVRRIGAVVDALHGASMLLASPFAGRRRTAVAVQVVLATCFCVSELVVLGRDAPGGGR